MIPARSSMYVQKLVYAIYVSHVRRRVFQIIIFEKVEKHYPSFFFSQFHWRKDIESPYNFERERYISIV